MPGRVGAAAAMERCLSPGGDIDDMNKVRTYYVIDIETTGLSVDSCEVCEIAALKVQDDAVVDEFETMVHIDGEMPPAVSRVNNITPEMLEGAPHARAALRRLAAFTGKSPVLVGHNVDAFDLPILRRVAKDCGTGLPCGRSVDTLELARRAWPGRKSHSMAALRKSFGISSDGAHRALKDCKDELEVYLRAKAKLAEGA